MNEFEYRGEKKEIKKSPPPHKLASSKGPPKNKFDFKKKKDNTVKSLFEIEHFLRDFKQVAKGIKFYNVFKW